MTTDKNIESNLEYLDNILKYLVNYASHYTLSFSELYRCLYNRDFESDNKFNAINHLISISEETNFFEISISNNQKALGEKLVEACYYLRENGFIRISQDFNVKITFKGILKYSNNFVNEHKNNKSKTLFDRFSVYVTIAISLVTLVLGYLIG